MATDGSNFLSTFINQREQGFKWVTKMRISTSRTAKRLFQAAAGVSVSALLAGCGWFDNSIAVDMGKPRAGAETNVQPSSAMPAPPTGHSFDPPIMPVDETASAPKIGSIVAESGGQKAQLEKLEKDEASRDAQERAAQIKADEQEKIDNARDAAVGTQANRRAPGVPDVTTLPATRPTAAPPAPVTSTPMPPPPSND